MKRYICTTCGTQYPTSERPPEACPICEDERQFVPPSGQAWTTMDELTQDHANRIEPLEPGLFGIGTEPQWAIGQRALLVQTPEGNVLWDCITLLDEETRRRVEALGGISAIAISHPHFYSGMVEWAHAFKAPIHLHAADQEWVVRPDPAIRFWEGERLELLGSLTLHRLGGHFEGSQVLHWPAGAEGRGALLVGDTVQVASDREWVGFMYSFPNYVPLRGDAVQRIGRRLEPLAFDRIYGGWWDRVVDRDGHEVIQRSVERYLRAIGAPMSASLPIPRSSSQHALLSPTAA